jgi:hypothetical protein
MDLPSELTDKIVKGKYQMRGRAYFTFVVLSVALISTNTNATDHGSPAERQAFFGDLHIHTMYSFDAFLGSVRTTPDDAYRYAKGEPIDHPAGMKIRLGGPPLDFLMVADHAKFLGVFAAQLDPKSPIADHPESGQLMPGRGSGLDKLARRLNKLEGEGHTFLGPTVSSYAWQKNVDAAERHNDPGTFTAFIGYEYTPTPGNRHLHRNVVFRGSDVPERPFSSSDSGNPEDLWHWLDRLRSEGMEALAIPHNMNQSDGLAFQATTFRGEPINRDFAEQRMRNEPIAEISQQKGTSETHPSLSPNDEWADFQIVQYYLNRAENKNPISVFKGGYYRDALKMGLAMQARDGFNPYQLGAIGSSDSHLSAGPYEEDAHFSGRTNTPQARGSAYPASQDSWEDFWTPRQATHGTGGLAGIWAEENTRSSLYDAMRRRETFATSGPRIRVRLFGGFNLPKGILDSPDLVSLAYTNGVPMGGMLRKLSTTPAKPIPPSLLVWATRDPSSGWLQRIQIIKGWMDDGEPNEAIFDLACSDGLAPAADTHRCPDNGAVVNLNDCSISRDTGAVELSAIWQDPDFNPDQQAFYYARVLENPTCRWSTWDAIRIGIAPNPDLPSTHQERAWSSPIWYQP